jgi:hypothetical protein
VRARERARRALAAAQEVSPGRRMTKSPGYNRSLEPPRGVAQLAEHRSPKPGVAGSSPAAPVPLGKRKVAPLQQVRDERSPRTFTAETARNRPRLALTGAQLARTFVLVLVLALALPVSGPGLRFVKSRGFEARAGFLLQGRAPRAFAQRARRYPPERKPAGIAKMPHTFRGVAQIAPIAEAPCRLSPDLCPRL